MSEFMELERKLAENAKRAAQPRQTGSMNNSASSSAAAVGMSEFMELERRLQQEAAEQQKQQQQHNTITPPSLDLSDVKPRIPGSPPRAQPTPEQLLANGGLGPKPQEPDASECCGNGCQACVWIDYWQQLTEWEEKRMALEAAKRQAAGS